MRAPLIVLAAAVLALGGCASSSGGSEDRDDSRNPDIITSEELRETDLLSQNAYNAIQRLRPSWLRARGSSFSGARELPVIFVNRTRFGSAESLRSITVTNVAMMEYLDARDATTRYGTGYPAGAIIVSTH